MTADRVVKQIIKAVELPLGINSVVQRSIGIRALRHYSPFLLLDDFKTKPSGGFPDHAHHGQQTITYVLKGAIKHEDSTGSVGELGPGSLQFMTAGRGIMHSERASADEATEGIQLWVDLDRKAKDMQSFYKDLPSEDVTVVDLGGNSRVRLFSGEFQGHKAKQENLTTAWYMGFHLQNEMKVTPKWPDGWRAFLYVVDGKIRVGTDDIDSKHIALLDEPSSRDDATITSLSENTHVLFAAGKPLEQAIYQDGLFVESSKERLKETARQFKEFSGGFEHAKGWKSESGPDKKK